MPKTAVRGPYAKSKRVRDAIVEAAFEEFGASGYRGATMAAVADRVGMTLPGLKYYFANKDRLLQAVLEARDTRDSRGTTPTTDGRADLLATLTHTREHPGLAELHCILSAEATVPEHPAHGYFQDRYATLRAGIELAAEQGQFKTTLQPSTFAVLMLAVLDGVQLQWLLDKDAVDLAAPVMEFLDTVTLPVSAPA